MDVTNTHPSYDLLLPEWQKAKAFYDSERAVKAGTIRYVTPLGGQTDEQYAAYLSRGPLSMFFKKTVNTYVGLTTRKPYYLDDGEQMKEYLETASANGMSFGHYLRSLLVMFYKTGRGATLLDLPEGPTTAQPSLLLYDEESITNWDVGMVDGKERLNAIMLMEDDTKGDYLDSETTTIYRELILVDGVYTQRLYDDKSNLLSEVVPVINNSTLDYIPIVVHGGIGVKPVFLCEVLDQNVHHFQTATDQMHGLHFQGLINAYITGADKEEAPTTIGPEVIWCFEDPATSVGILESHGNGLDAVADKLKVFEETISTVSISTALSNAGSVTATQASIDFSNNSASLTGVVNTLSAEVSVILQIAADWLNISVGAFSFSTDFVSQRLSAQDLTAVVQAYMSGAISWDTFWSNLQAGEIGDPNREPEEEFAMIEETIPTGMQEPAAKQGDDTVYSGGGE